MRLCDIPAQHSSEAKDLLVRTLYVIIERERNYDKRRTVVDAA